MAQADFLFFPEDDQEPRFIQDFLLQASMLEGLIREFVNDLNKKNKINRIKQPRTFKQACREARVAGGISKKIFEKFTDYIDFRNDLVHKLLENVDHSVLEDDINQKYLKGSDLINILL